MQNSTNQFRCRGCYSTQHRENHSQKACIDSKRLELISLELKEYEKNRCIEVNSLKRKAKLLKQSTDTLKSTPSSEENKTSEPKVQPEKEIFKKPNAIPKKKKVVIRPVKNWYGYTHNHQTNIKTDHQWN